MKKLLLVFAFFNLHFSIYTLLAQAPQAIPFQAAARDNNGNVLTLQIIYLRFSIHDASASGTIVYKETQTATTNSIGLFTVNIGQGTVVNGTFASINWGISSKFLQVEWDADLDGTYDNMGTQQMLSVPYAFYAANVNWTKSGNDISNSNSGNVGIGTAAPSAKLDVNGDASFNGVRVGKGNGDISSNTVSGYQALNANTQGIENTAVGYNSMYSNITGGANTAIGFNSLYTNSSGDNNTAIGYWSLYANTTGNNNAGLGFTSLRYNTTGSNNTALGEASMRYNTTGYNNTATGQASLFSNTNGYENTATGAGSLFLNTNGIDNTATGMNSLHSNTEGSYNTATGINSLYSNTTGFHNTASGEGSLYSNTDGYHNTASGYDALVNNTNGNDNAGFGSHAMYFNTIGEKNTGLGSNTLYNNSTGSFNTASGHSSLNYNTTGNYNTASGYYSLLSNTTGWYNTGVGFYANVANGTINNSTAIGYAAVVDASNKVRLGNVNVSSNGGQVNWTAYSDARIKDNVQDNVPGMEFINQLRPVTYHYNVIKQNQLEGQADTMQWEGKYDIEKIQFSGFLAQEVDAAAEKIGYDFSGVDKSGKILGLRYAEFVVPLVQAVKEQQTQIETLQTENENLRAENNKMKIENTFFKTEIEKIKAKLGMDVKAEK